MKVRLIAKTPNILPVMYTAAHGCYSDRLPEDIFIDGPVLTEKEEQSIWDKSNNPQEFLSNLESFKKDKMLKTVRGCIARKHSSVMTHTNFTFTVSGVSRVLTHQVMRHHTGVTFDQQSARYVTFSGSDEWVLPQGLSDLYKYGQYEWLELTHPNCPVIDPNNEKLAERVYRHLEESKALYKDLMASDMHKEDARYILPHCMPTNFTMTINLTALFHIYNLRAKHTTGKSQKEIADFMELVVAEVIKSEPWLSEFLK